MNSPTEMPPEEEEFSRADETIMRHGSHGSERHVGHGSESRATMGDNEATMETPPTEPRDSQDSTATVSFRDRLSTMRGSDNVVGQDALQPGIVLRHYELIHIVGTGGFGTVWKAQDLRLNREVAVKIPRFVIASAEDRAQFTKEAKVAAQLKHPYIVAVHDVDCVNGQHFIVHDFVHGQPLDEFLEGNSLSPRQAAEICQRIANAVSEAHRHSITHRDLKPSNILIDAQGQPHLLDFGLAKIEAVDQSLMTEHGKVLGTPA